MEERFETFTTLINSISRSIRRIKSVEIDEYNLKGSHVSILYYLYTNGKLTSKEICELCETDKANISRQLDYLESRSYIVCDSDAPKRYRNYFTLTELGREIGEIIVKKIESFLSYTSKGISENDLETMYKCLGIISDNLNDLLPW